MPQIADPNRHSLLAKLHCQRSDHKSSFQAPAFDRFDNRRKICEALGLESGRGTGARRKVSYRAGEVARDRKKADLQHFACLCWLRAAARRAQAPGFEPEHAQHGDYEKQPEYPTIDSRAKRFSLPKNYEGGRDTARVPSCSKPSSARMPWTVSTTCGCVASRGRSRFISSSQQIRAGLSESTMMRSASCAASSMSCVTSTTVRGSCSSMRDNSFRIRSRVR